MLSLLEKASRFSKPIAISGSLVALIASVVAIAVDGLNAIEVVDPIEIRVSRTILGIAWSMLGFMGSTMTRRDPKVPGIFLIAGAVGGLVSIPAYFVVPAVFMVTGGILFLLKKESSQEP